MDRRDVRLLDAAIEVLAEGGMRRLTHRAVDAAAHLPMGSTSNRFRTRQLLLVGVLERILEREMATWSLVERRVPVSSPDEMAAALGELLESQLSADRVLAQARRTIFVEAAHQPAVQAAILLGRAELASWMAPLLEELGSGDPPSDVEHVLALMDGLIGHQLATRAPRFDAVTPIRALLFGLLGDQCPPSAPRMEP
ncbi:MAG: TetR/AcrR family transcriptional regulator [Microthrixaceae bacterium]